MFDVGGRHGLLKVAERNAVLLQHLVVLDAVDGRLVRLGQGRIGHRVAARRSGLLTGQSRARTSLNVRTTCWTIEFVH